MYRHATNKMVTEDRKEGAVKYNMGCRMKSTERRGMRWAWALMTAKYRGRGVEGGTMRVIGKFRHQRLKVHRGGRSTMRRHGMWPHDHRVPSQQVSVSLGFWPRVAVIIKFHHWQWGLGERARTSSNVTRSGAEPCGVCTTEAMLEEYLD